MTIAPHARMEEPLAHVEDRLREMIAMHLDPVGGAPFWIDRAAARGVDIRRIADVWTIVDSLGEMTPRDLLGRPLPDYIPRRVHHRLDRLILGQTGGTTGPGAWTAYNQEEFNQAFITPFVHAAMHLKFPVAGTWLFIGPSGPHIIGKVVRRLANAMRSADPFSVDFDPRWARKHPEGSFARSRYVEHVMEQAMRILDEQKVTVLFTTPAVLELLHPRMTTIQRLRIEAVHYGGMALTREELLAFQTEHFPHALHLSGYGNTLFGCCLELSASVGRELNYFPHGRRLFFEVVDDTGQPAAPGEIGTVRFTRMDETFLILRMRERDEAALVPPPREAPPGFMHHGLRDPRPARQLAAASTSGLY